MRKRQIGFTLIELILSLALGLIITAAAVLLFLAGQRSLSMQQGVADVQDNANFGLNYIVQGVRLANLNNPKAIINDETTYGGIVLTSSINATKDNTKVPPIPLSNFDKSIVGATANVNLLSRSEGMTIGAAPMWSGASNVQVAGSSVASDQLVIQYTPEYSINPATGAFDAGFDCEGNALNFSAVQGRQVVVQRYFLREDSNSSANEPNAPLSLACDAGYYPLAGNPAAITRYGDAGEIVMKRVDHFRVLLNIQTNAVAPAASRRYVSIDDYMKMALPRPRVVSLQIGVLTRSAQPVGAESSIKDDQKFVVLDQTVEVKKPTNTTNKYVRQVVSQTIALRNVIGERGL